MMCEQNRQDPCPQGAYISIIVYIGPIREKTTQLQRDIKKLTEKTVLIDKNQCQKQWWQLLPTQ